MPKNAEEIGSHFRMARETMKKFNVDLCLAIGCPLFWSDNDIAKTWLSATTNGNDHDELLYWLNNDYYISKTRIPEDRLKRIIKLIKERKVAQSEKKKPISMYAEWAGDSVVFQI